MQAMDKMTRLQDYMLTKNKRKTDDEIYDSMEEEDNRILLAFSVNILSYLVELSDPTGGIKPY